MHRLLAALLLFVASAPAWAQSYGGTYTTVNPQGGTVTLILRQDDAKKVTGSLTGNNAAFDVAGEVTPDGLMGAVTSAQGNLYMMARLDGAKLVVILAEPGPSGQPNLAASRQIVFSRA